MPKKLLRFGLDGKECPEMNNWEKLIMSDVALFFDSFVSF